MPRTIVSKGGQTLIGGLNRVFHCNHYNAYLQMVVLLAEGINNFNPRALLKDALVPLVTHLKENGYSDKDLLEEFSYCGFGQLKQIDSQNWYTPHSHYGEAIYEYGQPEKSCFFTAGYIEAITQKVTEEIECQRLGADKDSFLVLDSITKASVLPFKYTINFSNPPEKLKEFNTNVDDKSIMQAVASLPLYGKMDEEENGLIDAFGVVLTNHFADYYNIISYKTYFNMINIGIPPGDSKEQFIQAGHICAFFTLGGIMRSPEWYAVVEPMCKNVEDWLHGITAIINCLGWGTWRLESLIVEKELIFRIYNSYEGIGFRRLYPITEDKQMSFLAMGVGLGLAHLFWKIDIREKPELTKDYYVNVFNNPNTEHFAVEQTHAIASGDEYDRIVVTSI